MDFLEPVAVCDVKVGMYCKLNEFLKICMCLRSVSFSDLGPRSLRFCPHQHFQTSPQKPLVQSKSKLHVDPPWDGGMKVCSNDHDHMTKMVTMPIYGKNLLKNHFADILETFYTCVLPNVFKLTFLRKGQLWFLMHLYGERLKCWITQKLLKSMIYSWYINPLYG